MSAPLVSIIIPVYNAAPFLRRAIDSALGQTHSNLEIILVDDGSTDGSTAICDEYAQKDARVKALHQPNRGVGTARNAGLGAVSGAFVTFLDADDELDREAVDHFVFEQQRTGAQLVFGTMVMQAQTNTTYPIRSGSSDPSEFLLEHCTSRDAWIVVSNAVCKLFQTSLIQANALRFDESLLNGEDSLFLLSCIAHAQTVATVNAPCYLAHRYDEQVRQHLTSCRYYDFIDFLLCYYQQVFSITQTADAALRQRALHFFYDRLIAELVVATAYRSYFPAPGWKSRLKEIMRLPLVAQAAPGYNNTFPGGSRAIPYFLEKQWFAPLWAALLHRACKYEKERGLSSHVRSIHV